MDSFKTGAGVLSICNFLIEISLFAYISKATSNVGNISNDLDMKLREIGRGMGNKINEMENNSAKLANAINEITDTMKQFNKLKKTLMVAINELHASRAEMDARIDQIENYMDIIIQTLEKDGKSVEVPKPKPVSRFGRVHMNVSDKSVSFSKSPREKSDKSERSDSNKSKKSDKSKKSKKSKKSDSEESESEESDVNSDSDSDDAKKVLK